MSSNATEGVLDASYGGSIPIMWIPCVVFAHLFAFSFLFSMFRVTHPAAWDTAKRRLLCRGKRPSGDGTAPTAATIAAATAASTQGKHQASCDHHH
jgi:hypothetical protein